MSKQQLQPAENGRAGRRRSAASYAAKVGMLAALSFVLSFLEFPVFPQASFLKLDFSSVITLTAGFALGPAAGIAVCFVKEALCLLKSSTGGVGEIANFIITTCFIAVPTVAYKYRRTLPTVMWSLAVGCALEIGASLLSNRFVNFPLFMGSGAAAVFRELWPFVLAFNAIKCVAVSAVSLLVYKKAASLMKRF